MNAPAVHGGEEYDTDFVFHPGRGKFVPVVHSPSQIGCASKQQKQHFSRCNTEDGETSADEDCEVEPPPGYCFIWKRDEFGEKYFVQKKIKHVTEFVETYVCDEQTGRWYKRSISKAEFEKIQPARNTAMKAASYVPTSTIPSC